MTCDLCFKLSAWQMKSTKPNECTNKYFSQIIMNYLIKYSPQKFSNLQNYDLYWIINILNLSVCDFQTLTRHKKLLKIKLTVSKIIQIIFMGKTVYHPDSVVNVYKQLWKTKLWIRAVLKTLRVTSIQFLHTVILLNHSFLKLV